MSIVENTSLNPAIIEAECHITNGLPQVVIIGDASKAVEQARERLRASFSNSAIEFPKKRVTINLSPADIPKVSTNLDLAMAVSIMIQTKQIDFEAAKDYIFLGELNLEGKLNGVRGLIGKLISAKKLGHSKFIIPYANLDQARLVPEITIKAATSLRDVYLDLSGTLRLKPIETNYGQVINTSQSEDYIDFSEIIGQPIAKRAMEIAAAGHHNILLDGPPGTGKTMLARAMCGILPLLNRNEVLEVTHIHSLASGDFSRIITQRPFRSPHHSASSVALIGGGSTPKPGEASLAHRGVLFLDELPEFGSQALEALRQPLEDGIVSIARVKDSATYPAEFILVATQNPCPCGFFGTDKPCVCTASAIMKYRKKISGPILDRIDIHLSVNDIDYKKLLSKDNQLRSESLDIRKRVKNVYKIQQSRFGKVKYNSSMTNKDIRELAGLTDDAKLFLDEAAPKLELSARGYVRTVKLARTIADLDISDTIEARHITEALQYRQKLAAIS